MTLSIITVNLNNVHGLRKTMESVLAQTNREYEWIVIDAGSTDGSVDLLKRNTETIDSWVSEPDQGIYSGMNKGILKASGDYLLFLNSGDFFADETIVESFYNLPQHQDFIVGQVIMEGDTAPHPVREPLSLEDEMFRLCISAYPHQATFLRRTLFQKYGLYREDLSISSDWLFSINAIVKGNASVFHWPVTVSVCEKNGISSRFREKLEQERAVLQQENPYFNVLFDFYKNNRDIVSALKSNRIVYSLFRFYFFLYRKFK